MNYSIEFDIKDLLEKVDDTTIIEEAGARGLSAAVNDYELKDDGCERVDEFIDSIDDVFSDSFTDVCILGVTAGTTGFKGGAAHHGGKTFVTLEDLGGSNMMVSIDGSEYLRDAGKITVAFGGDAELTNFIEGLRFALSQLEGIVRTQVDYEE